MEEICRPYLNLTIGLTAMPPQADNVTIELLTPHEENQCFVNREQQPPVICEFHVDALRTRFSLRITVPATRSQAASDCAVDPAIIFAFKYAYRLEVERVVTRNLSCVYRARLPHS